jgi:glycosyltransferase involved in cell wall biosynthesis
MKIALSTPVDLRALATYFGREAATIPAGLGSTATTPLIAALLDRGHQVSIYTLSLDLQQEIIIRGPRLTAFVGPMRSAGRARNVWKDEIDYLAGALARERPAFVHAHWTYEFAMGALKSGVPTITTIHDLPWNVLRYFRDSYRAARLLLAYKVAWRGKRYTAVSSDAARHFRRYLRPNAHITVIPNFLPDAVFAQGANAGADPHPLTFYTVLQGWTTRKNGTAALRAFATVRQRLPDSRLLMIGTDYEALGIAHAWAQRHGFDQQVEFRGPLPYSTMLASVRAEADILVHPSLDESFSMAALEAMVLGKPVIAGRRTPGVREVLGFGRCGLLVDVKSPQALAAAMVRLALDLDLRENLSATAYASAYQKYRAKPVLDTWEALYSELEAGCTNASLPLPAMLAREREAKP